MRIFLLLSQRFMRIVHFMNRNNRLPDSVYASHIRNAHPDRDRTSVDTRIAAMRASGMSIRAIRRALGLDEAAATAAGLLEPGRMVAARAPGVDSNNARSPDCQRGPSMAEVLDSVSRDSGIDREVLVAPSQWAPAVRARHLIMVLIREFCPQATLAAIGLLLHRERTTVLYGCRRAEVLLRRDRSFRAAYRRTRLALRFVDPEAGSRG
jgi:chromosomal replication initiation ATPase DnaA